MHTDGVTEASNAQSRPGATDRGPPNRAEWHQQIPAWASALDAASLTSALHDHISATVGHFRGHVRSWDVVNEAIADGANDPDAQLVYNDYGIEGIGPKSYAVYALVQALLALGAPISANVGVAWATTPSFARIFLEGPPAGTDIIVDDASVHLLAPP